jgi:predicted MFS family arabinose efflux permease
MRLVTVDQYTAKITIVFLLITGSFIFYTFVSEALLKIQQASEIIKNTQQTVTITVKTGAK